MKNYAHSAKEPPFDRLPVPAKINQIEMHVSMRILDRHSQQIVFPTESGHAQAIPIGHFEKSKWQDHEAIKLWTEILREREAKTYAFTHGFGGSIEHDDEGKLHKGWIPKAIDQLSEKEKKFDKDNKYELVNFLAFDWSKGAKGEKSLIKNTSDTSFTYKLCAYDQAASNTRPVGVAIAEFFRTFAHLLSAANTHLIGFSLGAHVMGFAGKQHMCLRGCAAKFARITGLDPAGPLFSVMPADGRLDATDAAFVDVIHTNAGIFGIRIPVGHVDFWVGRSPEDTWLYHNEHKWGSAQPGCFDCRHKATANVAFKLIRALDENSRSRRMDIPRPDEKEGDVSERVGMSHYRAHIYFRHTIDRPNLFKCLNKFGKTVVMGCECRAGTSGSFNIDIDSEEEEFKQYFPKAET